MIQKEIQKVARECTLSDHMEHTSDLFLLEKNHENFCDRQRLGTPHGQKCYGFDGLRRTPFIEAYKKMCEYFWTHVLCAVFEVELDGNIYL